MTTLVINGVTVQIGDNNCPTAPAPAGAPAPLPATPSAISPGNGWSALCQGQNPVSAAALEPISAFMAVSQSVGGVKVSDGSEADRTAFLGIVTASTASGLQAPIVWGGPVINNINGSGGWNFVVGANVYVGADGVVTQTAPITGFADPIGFAISANAIMLGTAIDGSLDTPIAPRVHVLPFDTVIPVNVSEAEVFDLTLTANTALTFSGGIDGKTVTLRVSQDSVGGRTMTVPSSVVGTAYTPVGLAADAQTLYQLQYNGASGKYVVLSASTI